MDISIVFIGAIILLLFVLIIVLAICFNKFFDEVKKLNTRLFTVTGEQIQILKRLNDLESKETREKEK